MAKTIAGPIAQVVDRLGGGGCVQAAQEKVTPDNTQNFDVYDVGRHVIPIGSKAAPNLLGPRRACQYLIQAGCVNDQHPATDHGARRGPR